MDAPDKTIEESKESQSPEKDNGNIPTQQTPGETVQESLVDFLQESSFALTVDPTLIIVQNFVISGKNNATEELTVDCLGDQVEMDYF